MNQAGDIHAFAAACGATLPLRFRVTDERNAEVSTVQIERPYAVVGSSEFCDVRLAHPDVSRHHAYIQVLDGQAVCCDLASRTGTHWGTEIRSRSRLTAGEPIYLGPFRVELIEGETIESQASGKPGGQSKTSAPVRTRQPNMHLTFLNALSRSGRSRISRLRDPVTLVGWSHLCNLRLQHRSVGRVHCSLVWTEAGVWAVDLMGSGGTRVNDELVNFARLDDRDELTLGRFQLKIAYGSSAEMPLLGDDDAAIPPDELEPLPAPIRVVPTKDKSSAAPARPTRRIAASPEVPPQVPMPMPPQLATPLPPSLGQLVPRPGIADLRPIIGGLPMPMPMPVAGDMALAPMNEGATVSLMQQFAMMQQQMFDHTYQLLAVVTDAFQSAHNQQLQLIREEMIRVHELNRELAELNQRKSSAAPDSEAVAAERPAPVAPAGFPGGAPPAAGSVPRPAPVAREEPGPGAAKTDPAPPGAADARQRPRQTVDDRASGSPAGTAAKGAASEAGDTPDVHAWLSGRISELTEERTSRWQKILQLLTQSGGPGK